MDPIDGLVGDRIRTRRRELKLSQARLSATVGVTFQQLRKYELGLNRVSASRLHALALALEVRPEYFFGPPTLWSEPTDDEVDLREHLRFDDCRMLNESFARIKNSALRKAIIAMLEAMTQ